MTPVRGLPVTPVRALLESKGAKRPTKGAPVGAYLAGQRVWVSTYCAKLTKRSPRPVYRALRGVMVAKLHMSGRYVVRLLSTGEAVEAESWDVSEYKGAVHVTAPWEHASKR